MKSKHKKLPKKWLIVLTIVLLAGGLLFLEKTRTTDLVQLPGNSNTVTDEEGPTPEQKAQEDKANAEAKQEFIDNEEGVATAEPQPDSNNISLTAKQENNESVTVFTKLPGYSDGDCTLTVTNGSRTTTQTAKVFYQREASTCAGFSVPIDPLGIGDWNIRLTVVSDNSTASKSITFEVD